MKNSVIALTVGMLVGVVGSWIYPSLMGGAESSPANQTPVVSLPDLPEPYYRVLFENEAVRVVDHRLAPGEREPEHTHPPMVVYFVSGATLRITEVDGSTSDVSIPTGTFLGDDDLRWWTHSLENTGDTPLHSILVELKPHEPVT